MTLLRNSLIILFLFFPVQTVFPEQNKPKQNKSVLYISSYHPGFPSFNEQVSGIKWVFHEKDINLDIEFMDTKRFPEPENIENFKTALKYKLGGLEKYDLVISADDNALLFVLSEREIFLDIPIVFLGVNNIEKALEQNNNPLVTGVIEAVSIEETIAVINRLHPKVKKIIAISDSATSGESDLKTFYKAKDKFKGCVFSHISLKELSWKGFEKKLSGLGDDDCAILILSAYFDKNGEKKSFKESLGLIVKNTDLPLYHLWRHGIGEGIVGGKIISHFYQGKRAAEKAVEILNGKPADEIPVDGKSPNRFVFDHKELKRFNIDEESLPEECLIINRDKNFFSQHKSLIIGTSSLIFILLTLLITALVNIIQRKKTEEELKESEQKYLSLFENNHSVMLLIDLETLNIVDANPAAQKFYGLHYSEITKMKISDINILSHEEIGHEVKKAMEARRNHFYFKHKTGCGDIKDVEVYTGKIAINQRPYLYSIIHDITEQKKNEKELQKMERIRSVGRLAGGIAHDFNNILMAIFGNLSVAMTQIEEGHPAREFLEDTEKAIERATRLTKQLLTFSKGGQPLKEDICIYNIAKDITSFDLSGSNVKANFLKDKDLWAVKADKGQIQQVFSNIIINADQAMPEGGHINLNFENFTILNDEIHGLEKGKYLKISIKDYGKGIPPNEIDRIFEPYFSTKSRGNGLGLATVYSIISRHNGKINVESKEGKGTEFTILLPAEERAGEFKDFIDKDIVREKIHKSRILVMDDDEMILNVVGNMLSILGYTYELCKDGDEAISLYEKAFKSEKPFGAVIMDLTIPGGKGGKYAISEIIKIDPHVRALISSGYTDNDIISNYKNYGFKAVVNKPYTRRELEKKLQDILS